MPYARIKKFIAGLLVATIIAPSLFVAPPTERAHALFGVGDTVIEVGGNLFTNLANTVEAVLISLKEYVADGLAYAIVNAIIRQMSADIINWINSGFNGNPAFVTDLGGLLGRVGDEVAGDFIYNSELSFLCSPFSLDVQLSIALSYFSPDGPECTLSDVVDNIDGFLTDFEQGGWRGWYELSVRDHNNPYDAYLKLTSQLSVSISNSQQEEFKLLDFGEGFLSWRDCEGGSYEAARTTGAAPPDDGTRDRECPIATPGSVIQGELEKALDLPADRLVLADEINEILSVLFVKLLSEALGGSSGGVRGLSSGSTGRSSYLNRLRDDNSANASVIENAKDQLIPRINRDLDTEIEYRSIKQQTLDKLNEAAQKVRAVRSCYEEKIESGRLSRSEEEIARERIAAASSTIATDIDPERELIKRNINSSREATATLEGIAGRLLATGEASEAEEVSSDYTDLKRNGGTLHTAGDLTLAEQERTNIGAEMNNIIEQAEKDLEECEAFGTDNFANERQ